jgi:hypothetical protein
MTNFNISIISQEMAEFYPSKKTDYKSIAQNYLEQIKQHLLKGILMAKNEQINDDLIPVSWRELRFSCGKYGTRAAQHYWFDWFQQHHPLIIKIKDGYRFGRKGTLTMVKANLDLEILLAGKNPEDIFRLYYANKQDLPMDWVTIDTRSLNRYISANRAIAARNNTLDQNLKDAQVILAIAECCNGQMPMEISESSFGRKYYRGPNLQSCNKIVRHAALGDCYQYDIEASVFTWKLDTTKTIDSTIKLPATIDYLEFKRHHRQRLAKLVYGNKSEYSVNTIKQVITAIGFGAKATGAMWQMQNGKWTSTALRQIITSRENLSLFLNDPWVKEFIAEQDLMNLIIFNVAKPQAQGNKILYNDNNQLSRNKTIAYAYQQFERTVIDQLLTVADPAQVLLLCHDGFYTKYKANLGDLRSTLIEYLPSGTLDMEQHKAYYFVDYHDENAHAKHIQQEELAVLGYIPEKKLVNKQFTKHSIEGYADGSFDENAAAELYDFDSDLYYEDYSAEQRRQIKQELYPKQQPSWVRELL